MAAGEIHGVVTLALLAAAGAAVWWWRAKPSRTWAVFALVVTVSALLSVFRRTAHLCDSGQPARYWLYMLVTVPAALLFVRSRLKAILIGMALIAGWSWLACDYTRLVHLDDYKGNPHRLGGSADMPRQYLPLDEVRAELMQQALKSQVTVPAGDLLDALRGTRMEATSPAEHELRNTFVTQCMWGDRAHWYTPVTGLWRVGERRYVVTTPGGRLSEIAERIEVREVKGEVGLTVPRVESTAGGGSDEDT